MSIDILSNLIITKIYSATTMYTEKNKKAKRVNRSCWAFVIKYEGETVYLSQGQKILSDKNNLVILPKGCSYEWSCTREGHYMIVEFESDLICKDVLSFYVENSDNILKIFKALEHKRTVRKTMCEVESIRDMYSIFLMLSQNIQKKYFPADKRSKITSALDYITENYNTEIKNEDLAKLCGLSTVYFRKLFTDVVGASPISFVQSLRIKKAKEMLKSDYGSIGDIAQSLGYLNIYDFSRAFKKYVGISPLKYVKQINDE